MISKDEIQLRERMIALAANVAPERVLERAEEYLSFVRGGSAAREKTPKDK